MIEILKAKILLSIILLIVLASSLQLEKAEKHELRGEKHEFWKGGLDAFRQGELKRHNQYRAQHGAPPLVLSDDLNNIAQAYAQKIARANSMQHSGDRRYGENLWMWSASPARAYTPGTASDSWYNEVKQYNFNSPSFNGATGHFTQLVWIASKRVGFGIGTNGGSDYVVANYDPPGNFNNDYRNNVLPKGSSPKSAPQDDEQQNQGGQDNWDNEDNGDDGDWGNQDQDGGNQDDGDWGNQDDGDWGNQDDWGNEDDGGWGNQYDQDW